MVGMKETRMIIAMVALVGCGSTPTAPTVASTFISDPADENNVKIEVAIRTRIKKPTGKLTKADLAKVKVLWFPESNGLTDMSALAGLKQMEELYLSGNKLPDASSLAELTQLKVLDLWNNRLTDASGLAGLTQLEMLHLRGNRLTDVSALAGLTNLKYLNLGDNHITDVSTLVKLTQLRSLQLRVNRITDVSALAKLTQLRRLWLKLNPNLTKGKIDELQRALPKCEITHDFE